MDDHQPRKRSQNSAYRRPLVDGSSTWSGEGMRTLHRSTPSLGRWIGPAVIAVASAAMLIWSWGTWPDALIDFGWELYVPWQLSLGKVFYLDIASFKGPLSVYVNSLWFRLFGVSLCTLVICNLLLLAALMGLVYRVLTDVSDWFSSTCACLVFVAVFAFGQLVQIGNYNFICPYSHELTHSLLLAFAALYLLQRYLRSRHLASAIGIGLLSGLTFLAKVEVFLAMIAAIGIGIWLLLRHPDAGRRAGLRFLAAYLPAALMPPLVALCLFSRIMPFRQALLAILGSWPVTFNGQLGSTVFYQWSLGMLEPARNVAAMLEWLSRYALLFIPTFCASFALRYLPSRWIAAARLVVVATTGAVVILLNPHINWLSAGRSLPVIMGLSIAVWWTILLRHSPKEPVPSYIIMRVVLSVFALVLLGKIVLNARLWHYGFALSFPATLLLVVALLSWAPAALNRAGGDGISFRLASLVVLAVAVVAHVEVTADYFRQKSYTVGWGLDRFRADPRGMVVNAAAEEILRRVKPDQTLAVLPEGVILNYLTRRTNPTPYPNVIPADFLVFGENRIVDAFQTHPPDYIALITRDTIEYGFQGFGYDHGQRLMSWIAEHYRVVWMMGGSPVDLNEKRFGLWLLEERKFSNG